jgi:hypothetical protein
MHKRILFPATVIAASLFLLSRHAAMANTDGVEAVDVVSAASLTVSIISITSTTAVASYNKDKYDYGTRTLCYDPAPAVASHNCTTRTAFGNAGTFNISGLLPGTTYNFSIKAVDTSAKPEKPYTTSGTFTTSKATAIGTHPAGAKALKTHSASPRSNVDLSGRNVDVHKSGAHALKTFGVAR